MKRGRNELEPSDALTKREYVLFISGTMNPPHIGHVRLGLSAAHKLREAGHEVSAICYAPVHDNYLANKVVAKRASGGKVSVVDTIAFPMSERCALLRTLLETETSADTRLCHVLDYEHSGDGSLLATSPGYWAPKLPDGYLKTVPTTAVIAHFAAHSPLMRRGARLGVVFGVDNLAGMASWNSPGELLTQADLVLLARAMPQVTMGRDPAELLSALKYLQIDAAVPVVYEEDELLGGTLGSFENRAATGNGALFMLPALEGADEGLSSTRIREAIAAKVAAGEGEEGGSSAVADGTATRPEAILAEHGYPPSSLARLLEVATTGEEAVDKMVASGKARHEWVVP